MQSCRIEGVGRRWWRENLCKTYRRRVRDLESWEYPCSACSLPTWAVKCHLKVGEAREAREARAFCLHSPPAKTAGLATGASRKSAGRQPASIRLAASAARVRAEESKLSKQKNPTRHFYPSTVPKQRYRPPSLIHLRTRRSTRLQRKQSGRIFWRVSAIYQDEQKVCER